MFKIFNKEIDAFGLDLSSPEYLKMAKIVKEKNELKLALLNQKKIKDSSIVGGKVKNLQNLSRSIKEFTEETMKGKFSTKYVTLAIPEESCFLKTIKMPAMNRRELASAIYYEAENHFPFSAESLYIDFHVVSREHFPTGDIDVLVVACPKEILDQYVLAVERAGFINYMIESAPFAIVRSFLNQQKEKPFLFININNNSVTYIIFAQKCIRFTTSFERSPSIKSKNTEENYQNMIIAKTFECLEYYSRNHEEKESVSEIIISGDFKGVKGIKEKLFSETETTTLIGDSFLKINKNLTSVSQNNHSYGVVIGVALKPFLEEF